MPKTPAPHVSAIAVVDLARELKRHSVISLAQIQAIDRQLADNVVILEEGRDISGLIESRYPESWLLTLWRLADKYAPNTGIGARIGAIISPEARGLLANLMLYCDNLKDVLETYLANIEITNASESWQINREGAHVELIFGFMPGKPYPRCAVERSMVALYHWAQHLCGREIPVRSVEFAFPEPGYAGYLRSLFPCEMRFDSRRHALVFTEEVFSWPLLQRNRYVKSMLEQKIADLDLVAKTKSVGAQVRELLRKDLAFYHSIDSLTQALCMSKSTLYRKLKEEKTGFAEILDEERRRLLDRHRDKPVARLCDLLGFQDASAYYKACKRWNGGKK